MKSGKSQIHNLPINDVTSLGVSALDVLRERNIAAPGSTFGSVAEENYVRVALAASDAGIERGVQEIHTFVDSQ